MKLINLSQEEGQNEKWLKWREGKLTASTSAAIMGIHTYKTPYMLWESIKGLSLPTVVNPNMTRGKLLEGEARDAINELFDERFEPVCVEHELYPFLISSLDGLNDDKDIILEIKCPNPSFDNHISRHFGSVEEVKECCPDYYHQCQWQMLTTGPEVTQCVFATYWRGKVENIILPRDEEYIAECEKRAIKFYQENIIGDKEPKKIRVVGQKNNAGDFSIIEQEGRPLEIISRAIEIDEREKEIKKEISSQQKELKALDIEKKLLRDELVEHSDDLDFYCGRVCCTRVNKRGVDVEKMCRDHDINIDDYKSKDIGFWKLKVEAR